MNDRPTRATTAGQRYLDLRRLASQTGRATDELQQLYALEGFLDRLGRSRHARRLVLKGGVLLAAYDARRPTRDIDFSANASAGDIEAIRALVIDIAAIGLDDGLFFDMSSPTAEPIREEEPYSGVRVTLQVSLASFTARFHVDINVGDPVWPAPGPVRLPRLLGGEPLEVIGYPVVMVLAEKLVTALQRGTANTRWRDFVDIASLSPHTAPDEVELAEAIRRVARYRLAELSPLSYVLEGFGPIAQQRWAGWRRKQRLEASTPESFDALLATVISWGDAALRSAAESPITRGVEG